VADVIDSASTVVVVWGLDVVTAHVCGFVADLQLAWSQFRLGDWGINMVVGRISLRSSAAESNLVETAVVHVVRELGVRVNGIVVRLDAVGIVDSKLGVVLCLDRLIDDTVDYTERVEVHLVARHASVLDLQVLVVKVGEEGRTVVTSVRLGEEVEVSGWAQGTKFCVELGDGSKQRLENVLHKMNQLTTQSRDRLVETHPSCDSSKISSINRAFVQRL